MPALQRKARPNGYAQQSDLAPHDKQCPTCGSPISAEKFAKIQGTLGAHDAEIKRAVEARFAREFARMEAGRKAEIATAVKEAVTVAETKLHAIRQHQAGVVAAAVERERKKSTKRLDEAVAGERFAHAAEKLKLEQQLEALRRRVQGKTAFQLGEPHEVDLHTVLTAAFPHDLVERVGKGVAGGDINMTIHGHGGEPIGRIVLESKNHARWSNRFTEKLRSDMLAAEADFGVLVSNVFPANSGARELHLQDGVLVVSPSRAVIIVAFLRQQVIANHRLKLSAEARDEKGDRLLAFLTSPEATDHFDRFAKATDDMIDLEAREIDMQTGIHRKRGEMIRAIQASYEKLVASIESILGSNEPVAMEALV